MQTGYRGTLKVLSEVLFINFVSLCSLLHGIAPKFPNIVVRDSYMVSRHFETCYSHWAASNDHLRVWLHAKNVIVTTKFILNFIILTPEDFACQGEGLMC